MTQLTLTDACTAESLKQHGLAQVAVHADNFLRIMRSTARKISDEGGQVSVDNLRPIAAVQGLVPHSPNAWGAIFIGKHWKVVGYKKSVFATNHARRISVWRWEP